MKKVLIITYYWPPAGGPGVQRVLKFVRYLPHFGWQPIVLTVKHGEYPGLDPGLEKQIPGECQVYRTDIFEPGQLYRRFVGMKAGEHIPVAVLTEQQTGWKKRLANWVRLNLVIPDAKIGWKPYALKQGSRLIKTWQPHLIFSSSPPPTVHLIARSLARRHDLRWVADFRDPWTNIYHYSQHPKNFLSRSLDRRLENKVLNAADRITVVSPGFFDNLDTQKEIIIPNGFDSADLPPGMQEPKNKKFSIRYIGSFKDWQFVDSFFSSLRRLCWDDGLAEYMELEFIGNVDGLVKKKIEERQLPCEVRFSGFMPHDQAIIRMAEADMLLLTIGPSQRPAPILTAKIFEYLMVKKPIVAFVPPGGAADQLLKESGCGKRFDNHDEEGVYQYLKEHVTRWRENRTFSGFNEAVINRYERKYLTGQLVKIFDQLAAG